MTIPLICDEPLDVCRGNMTQLFIDDADCVSIALRGSTLRIGFILCLLLEVDTLLCLLLWLRLGIDDLLLLLAVVHFSRLDTVCFNDNAVISECTGNNRKGSTSNQRLLAAHLIPLVG